MKQFVKILVAYDGSHMADQALTEAIELAQQFKGSITVLIVYWDETDNNVSELHNRAETKLIETFIKYQIISEKSQNPPNRILWHAENGGYDLITIGGRGMGSKKLWVIGSVSKKVIDESSCPVLVIK